MPRSWRGRIAAAVLLVVALLLGLYAAAGFFDRDPIRLFAADRARSDVAAVYFSGDMGLRFGMGRYVADGLAKSGVPVLGISSSTAFATHHSRAQTDAIVADAIRQTLQRTGAKRIVVLGQSFGADIVRVGLAHLPQDLRGKVAAAVLVVPGQNAYFRADPSGLAYRGAPDATAAEAPLLGWLPLTCIRGATETDSLCPALTLPNVRRITLAGGHFLRSDHALLVQTILRSLGTTLSPMGSR
ncbi:Type IV secretory pathway VirJ component-like protein [Sphingomonas hengshuiensis]|uniref:Type IV secretory pathway VirJ component-like protein n=1 Tax=Sphingomonas hengshuiensis TaxID=1609977 RepID=A0A7U5BGD0_9SPHN|nr:Type IV secretory pathway VirJ component-like protein [Sphingomonas hengshuiensis]